VVKLNKILMKAIKTILKALLTLLLNIITFYLYKGKLPNCCKIIIIIIFKKKANKKDYSLLKSYWIIAFKNTLEKLLKKIVIKYIREIIKV